MLIFLFSYLLSNEISIGRSFLLNRLKNGLQIKARRRNNGSTSSQSLACTLLKCQVSQLVVSSCSLSCSKESVSLKFSKGQIDSSIQNNASDFVFQRLPSSLERGSFRQASPVTEFGAFEFAGYKVFTWQLLYGSRICRMRVIVQYLFKGRLWKTKLLLRKE